MNATVRPLTHDELDRCRALVDKQAREALASKQVARERSKAKQTAGLAADTATYQRALALRDEGLGPATIARELERPASTVQRWLAEAPRG